MKEIIRKVLLRLFFWKLPDEKHKKRRVVKNRGRQQTVRETLDNLDYHFSRLRIKDVRSSQNDWATRRALKKIGPYVVPPGYEHPDDSKILHDKRPSIMFVAPDEKGMHEGIDAQYHGKKVFPEFYYAVKQKRTPWNVQWTDKIGEIYEIGIAYAAPESVKKKETYWVSYFVNIIGRHALPLKYRYSARRVLPNGISIPHKEWTYGNIADGDPDEPLKDPYEWVSQTAHNIFNFWDAKREMWAVIVKKDGRRMNFSIPARDTKYYFKDRVKIKTPSGRSKPIVHYVRGFVRENGQRVIPHLRGLRRFVWNGYQVNVKNPELTGNQLIFDKFDIPGDSEVNGEKGAYNMPQVATILAPFDDEPDANIADIKKANQAKSVGS